MEESTVESKEREQEKDKAYRMAYKIAGTLSTLLVLLVVFIARFNCNGDGSIIIIVVILGLSGGLVGAIQKYRNTTEEEQSKIAEGSFCYHYTIPALIGGNFALVLMLIFAGNFDLISVNEAIGLFPKLTECPSSRELCSFWICADLAKLYVWSFIAGYSSRLVPTIIRGIGRGATGGGGKNHSDKRD